MMKSLFRILAGYTMFVIGCSADSGQSALQEGRQLLSQEIHQTFDELARPDGACLRGKLGNDKSCETSAAWKQYLSEACAAHGMQVESTVPTQSCGSDQFRYSEFSCRPQSASTVAPNCTQLSEGGPSVCKSIADWKQSITAACTVKGLQLAETYFGESCGVDAVHSVSYSCCGTQPLPAADDCQSFSQGDTCQSPDAWKRADTAQCASKGLALSDISLSGRLRLGELQQVHLLVLRRALHSAAGARPALRRSMRLPAAVTKRRGGRWRVICAKNRALRSVRLPSPTLAALASGRT